ncbi:MAG: alkaline phosphatase family protein [Planctomycetes bacterium]|nr:alkaline phosphatase family protein [Planctomycetota bacterium]
MIDRTLRRLAGLVPWALLAACSPSSDAPAGSSPAAGAAASGATEPGAPTATPPRPNGAAPSGLKVVVVGIDGATWVVMDPLLAGGELPAFAGLIERGTRAPLESQKPILSPCVWTTIATGRHREDHGIVRFRSTHSTVEKPKLMATTDRTAPALWNMVTSYGVGVGVIGWWVTWPAEAVEGYVVSDRVAYSRWSSWTDGSKNTRLTHPEELIEKLKDLVVDPVKAPPSEELFALADFTDKEREAILAADHPIPFHAPSVFKFGYCEQRTYERIGTELLSRSQPSLSLLFLVAVDPISHTYWHLFRPSEFQGHVDPDEARRVGKIVPAIYRHDDAYLAGLLPKFDANTVVIVVSDHGFKASGKLPGLTTEVDYNAVGIARTEELDDPVNVGQSGVHDLDGIFIAAGGPILKGAALKEKATVLDVAPTVLALLGLPVAKNMPGRVLSELIDPAFLARYPVTFIDAYEDRCKPTMFDAPAEFDDAGRTELLNSLGYTDVGGGK